MTEQSIRNELTQIEAALADVEAAMERLQTSEPVSDEGRDTTREALREARAHVAILHARAARGEIRASELASALDERDALEASLADESELEARYACLCALHEALERRQKDAYARLGKATYASLRADLAQLSENVSKAETAAESARQAERSARHAIADKLSAWPELAEAARAKYAESAPDHIERVLSALDALLTAIDEGRGKVPTVVNGVNILQFFNLAPETADAVLNRGIGRAVDPRAHAQLRDVLKTLRAKR